MMWAAFDGISTTKYRIIFIFDGLGQKNSERNNLWPKYFHEFLLKGWQRWGEHLNMQLVMCEKTNVELVLFQKMMSKVAEAVTSWYDEV